LSDSPTESQGRHHAPTTSQLTSGPRPCWTFLAAPTEANNAFLALRYEETNAQTVEFGRLHASGATYWQAGRMNEVIAWVEFAGAWLLIVVMIAMSLLNTAARTSSNQHTRRA